MSYMKVPTLSKALFYCSLAYYKLTSPFECSNYRIKLLISEFSFMLAMLGLRKLQSRYSREITLLTKFGTFRIRDLETDIVIASPSYERPDINELLQRMNESLRSGNKVVFIDVGASFGKYTIAIGSKLRRYGKQLSIYSFEPEPESYELLQKNIKLNNLTNVKTFPYILSNSKATRLFYYYSPMKQIVSSRTDKPIYMHTRTLDSFIPYFRQSNMTSLFIKLDVEEHEINVLKGGNKVVHLSKHTTLLIEDSAPAIARSLGTYLSRYWKFLVKKTTYNSFWGI